MSLDSATVLVGAGASAKAMRLQDAWVFGILNGAEIVLVGDPMMVGRGDFQSEVRGEEPSSLVGEEPRLTGRPICGECEQEAEGCSGSDSCLWSFCRVWYMSDRVGALWRRAPSSCDEGTGEPPEELRLRGSWLCR